MNRILGGLILAAIYAGLSGAGLGQVREGASPEPTEMVIRLKVQAAAAPKPVLKYRLLPELRDINPGNPIQGYMKCFAANRHFFSSKLTYEELEKLDDMPLKDLPVEKLRAYGGSTLRMVDNAARLDHPDWQVLLPLKNSWFDSVTFEELGQLRVLTAFLRLRLRGEIADHRFDDALFTLQTIFALCRHAAEHPSMLGTHTALSMANAATYPLEEMLGEPGCPNLFWALADLPQPFVDVRLGLQGEGILFLKEFSLVDDKTPMADTEMMKVVDRFQTIDDTMRQRYDPVKKKFLRQPPLLRKWFVDRVKDSEYVASARRRLVERGSAETLVRQFSPLQVVFIAQKGVFAERRDEMQKGQLLPYWQMEAAFAARESPRAPIPPIALGKDDFAFAEWVQNNDWIRRIQANTEQRFALLRCVEALRLHAAEHGGQLPAKLADVKLPLPVDQFTGMEFVYKLDGGTATLHGTPPRRFEKVATYNIRYEVTIVK
ncbi:MAG TPA: hypothetical protein VHR72_07565 [Gemmataceae bacterium]|jgi:hypothetical protein|nr:hypothetical protein [Gemmataceae bacterium]